MVLEVVLKPESHDGYIQLIHYTGKLPDTFFFQELALIYQHAVRFGCMILHNAVYICVLIDRDSLSAHTDS
ncbi:hypothetical protein D3C81_1624980 [compost metagenome]